MTVLVFVSSSIAGHPGERLFGRGCGKPESPSRLVVKPDHWTGMDNSSGFSIGPTSTTWSQYAPNKVRGEVTLHYVPKEVC